MNSHLIELRTRLLYCCIAITVLFCFIFLQADTLYTQIATPLLKQLPAGSTLIATQVTAPFLVPLKLSFIASIFIAMPFVLYQIWAFIAPGLYKQERKIILPLAIASCCLFYLGNLFAFYVICPLALAFFAQAAPSGVTVMTDISNYLDFMLTLLFSSGLAFQIPIVTTLLIRLGIMDKTQLANKRSYVIVLAFILGMLLTPPDVVSQILLALPMWGLFELGLLFSSASTKTSGETLKQSPE